MYDKYKERVHRIIFESDTYYGKFFDVLLLILIVLSVILVALETVASIHDNWGKYFLIAEWTMTVIFTLEYVLRIWSTHKPMKYVTSFFGIIDLISIVPTYLSVILTGAHSLMVIRILRLLRIFRVFKMARYLAAGEYIVRSIRLSASKITVFLFFIILMVCIFGAVMYLVEGSINPAFDSIPRSIYWAIVTLTTVGYGDISPMTPLGQMVASLIMIMGYGVIAVPTGIVSTEMAKVKVRELISSEVCRWCSREGHESDAIFCKFCGHSLKDSIPIEQG